MHTTAKRNRLYTVRLNHISMAKQLGYIEDCYNNYGRHSKVSIHRIIGKQRRVYKVANLCSHITLWEGIQVTYSYAMRRRI